MSNIVETPRGVCVLGGINNVLGSLHRVCPIYHSGPGCSMQTTHGEQGQSGKKWSLYCSSTETPASNMLEREVIFGGINKLRTTVQGAMEVFDADAYFILNGCTSGIIGDDIETLADEFREQGAPVYAVPTPGFNGDSNLGYEAIWDVFIDQVIEERPKDERLVNLFGIIPYHDPFWSGNIEEITRILNRLGLKVNTFCTEDQGIETVKGSSAAALNIILNPWIFKGPAEHFEGKFGVPSLRYPGLPVGATDTSRFVRQVAEALNLDKELVEEVIYTEEYYVYKYLGQSIDVVSWRRFAVVGDANAVTGITRYLANDFSFTPEVAIITEPIFRPADKERIVKELTELEYARPPKIIFSEDQYDINQALLENENITLIVGSSNENEVALEKGEQLLVSTFPIDDRLLFNRAIAGYRGSLTFTEDLYYHF